MATIRKRTWTNADGTKMVAFQLSYIDGNGTRHRTQFNTKAEANDERIRIEGELAAGVAVPAEEAITVAVGAAKFIADFKKLTVPDDQGRTRRERSTLKQYDSHVRLHIKPYAIAAIQVQKLTGPDCMAYARALEEKLSIEMAKKVWATFGQILDFCSANGWMHATPTNGISIRTDDHRPDIEDDNYFPTIEECHALWLAAQIYDNSGRAAAFVACLMFVGLRISELRGLRLDDLPAAGANAPRIRVRQRADQYGKIGSVKSKKGKRTIPIGPDTVKAINVWRLACPKGEAQLLFPNGIGNPENYSNLAQRLWFPLMKAAGLTMTTMEPDTDGKLVPIERAKFSFHAMRHAAVSFWIAAGAKPKQVMTWAGHASITITYDRYGHLFEDDDDGAEIMQRAARALEPKKGKIP
jgi:integrase